MRGAGHTSPSSNKSARLEFEAHVRGLREVPVEELSATFSILDMLAINEYQRKTSVNALASKPLPDDMVSKYGPQSDMLADNTSSYDEDGEDLLFEDGVILDIVNERRHSSDTELTSLFRVRRSVVTFILANWDKIEDMHELGQAG